MKFDLFQNVGKNVVRTARVTNELSAGRNIERTNLPDQNVLFEGERQQMLLDIAVDVDDDVASITNDDGEADRSGNLNNEPDLR